MDTVNKPKHIRIGVSQGKVIDFEVYKELKIDVNNLKSEIINQPSKHAVCSTITSLLKAHQERTNSIENLIEFMIDVENAMTYRRDVLIRLSFKPNDSATIQSYNSYISSLFVA